MGYFSQVPTASLVFFPNRFCQLWKGMNFSRAWLIATKCQSRIKGWNCLERKKIMHRYHTNTSGYLLANLRPLQACCQQVSLQAGVSSKLMDVISERVRNSKISCPKNSRMVRCSTIGIPSRDMFCLSIHSATGPGRAHLLSYVLFTSQEWSDRSASSDAQCSVRFLSGITGRQRVFDRHISCNWKHPRLLDIVRAWNDILVISLQSVTCDAA